MRGFHKYVIFKLRNVEIGFDFIKQYIIERTLESVTPPWSLIKANSKVIPIRRSSSSGLSRSTGPRPFVFF